MIKNDLKNDDAKQELILRYALELVNQAEFDYVEFLLQDDEKLGEILEKIYVAFENEAISRGLAIDEIVKEKAEEFKMTYKFNTFHKPKPSLPNTYKFFDCLR